MSLNHTSVERVNLTNLAGNYDNRSEKLKLSKSLETVKSLIKYNLDNTRIFLLNSMSSLNLLPMNDRISIRLPD
jgi:hypothetical protein